MGSQLNCNTNIAYNPANRRMSTPSTNPIHPSTHTMQLRVGSSLPHSNARLEYMYIGKGMDDDLSSKFWVTVEK